LGGVFIIETVNSRPSKYSLTKIGVLNWLYNDNTLVSNSEKFVVKEKSSIPFPFAASIGFKNNGNLIGSSLKAHTT